LQTAGWRWWFSLLLLLLRRACRPMQHNCLFGKFVNKNIHHPHSDYGVQNCERTLPLLADEKFLMCIKRKFVHYMVNGLKYIVQLDDGYLIKHRC
jgi:hypothetical protein